ncbi:MAG TPA: hypothetical protein VH677_03180 [Nitrososphaera sp.]|jgi:hypothetical protein
MSLLGSASKVAVIVAGGYLIAFFVLASGVVNASIEGAGTQAFIIPSRSVQTLGETAAITFILFIGLAGMLMLHRAGAVTAPRAQKSMLGGGFGIIGIAMFIGYLLISVKV